MKPVDVKSNTYIDFSKEVNDKNLKFKIVSNVRISKYINAFAKGYTPNWSEEVFVIKKVKNMLLMTSKEKKLMKHFTKTNCKKQIKRISELKK